jgi:hypothetical protein
MELTDEIHHAVCSLPKESEKIISDNDIFAELKLYHYITKPGKTKQYIDVDMSNVSKLVDFYYKKVFKYEEHIMMYNHNIIYSYRDCLKYIEYYKKYLFQYEVNVSLYTTDDVYRHVYLHITRINDTCLFIKPRDYDVFKYFIHEYYDHCINKIKFTIKFLEHNMLIYDKPYTFSYFVPHELLGLLCDINEELNLKHSFVLFREYGIPITIYDKIKFINDTVLNKYQSKNATEVIIDIKILLFEYYKYQYDYELANPYKTMDCLI